MVASGSWTLAPYLKADRGIWSCKRLPLTCDYPVAENGRGRKVARAYRATSQCIQFGLERRVVGAAMKF